MNPSRLLTRLDAAIASTQSQVKADFLRAERAGYLARLGRLDEARQVLSSLHMQYASRPHAVMSAWLAWAEGLLSYYSDMGQMARDKMRRAYALSGAARETQLHALAAAWMGLFDFAANDFESAARHVKQALELAAPDNHAALSRATLQVGQMYHYALRFDLAQPWYVRARQHAATDGDDTMLAAVMHNTAGMHANEWRIAALRGTLEPTQAIKQAALGVQSTASYEAMLRLTSLDWMSPMLRAQVHSLQGEYTQALSLFDAYLAESVAQGIGRLEPCFRAEMAWCRLQAGDRERARADARAAQQALQDMECDPDDLAATHCRLAAIHQALGEDEHASRCMAQAEEAWQALERDQRRALDAASSAAGAANQAA
jgi:tetratricopeptide (TPR) repeat protein